ncbi:MAG: hypothetical protein JWQ14_1108 [Adhaeribacter sp.]|nr:hypothetical protein [Adhaeribacter sp.]
MTEQPTQNISLNSQTISELMQQTQNLLNGEALGSEKYEALLAFKMALENIKPYLPEPATTQPDETELENQIREEIVIAGANENG